MRTFITIVALLLALNLGAAPADSSNFIVDTAAVTVVSDTDAVDTAAGYYPSAATSTTVHRYQGTYDITSPGEALDFMRGIFGSMKDVLGMDDGFVPGGLFGLSMFMILIPLLLVLLLPLIIIIVIIWLIVRNNRRSRKERNRESIARTEQPQSAPAAPLADEAARHGQPAGETPRTDTHTPDQRPATDRRDSALRKIFIGLGITAFCLCVQAPIGMGIGLFLAIWGAGDYYIDHRHRKDGDTK